MLQHYPCLVGAIAVNTAALAKLRKNCLFFFFLSKIVTVLKEM